MKDKGKNMKAKLFLKNTVILTIGSIVLRFISVAFGAYLSRQIGAEGMGLFQLIFSVYNLAATFATSGIYLSVTRLVAEEIGRGSYSNANDALRKCMIYGIFVSTITSVALFLFSERIGIQWLSDARTIPSLRLLAFALPFMAFSSSLRGYFFAIRNVIQSTSSQVFEQLVRMVIVSVALTFLLPKGMTWACVAIALGSVGGEALAFLYTFTLYMIDRKRRIFKPQKQKSTTKKVLSITIPVALSSYLRSALVTLENILIPKGFKKYGATGESALAQYGMMEAMVMPILTFPLAFLTSFSSLLVPELAEA
ncbi:MAG: oligosaccharide flippase family protein, partial [Oscillospiraceae bacterium]